MSTFTYDDAQKLLFLEAHLLDLHRWDDWMSLYTPDCVFWVPSWASDEDLVADPETSVNMMYLRGHAGLAARIYRVTSRDSYASLPLPQTSHMVGTVRLLDGAEGGDSNVMASWTCLSVEARRGKSLRGGRYEYALQATADGLKIRRKKVVLLEHVLDGAVDFYQI